jgi:YlmC/YmxH family sporulation protein
MKLTFNQLKKREVINVVDGKSFGNITDLELSFPSGRLSGITVMGRKCCKLFCGFSNTKLFIPESQIIKIGGDVILVNVRCGDTCIDSVNLNEKKPKPINACNPICPPNQPTNKNPSVKELFDEEYENY